jgi:hypothetical protein
MEELLIKLIDASKEAMVRKEHYVKEQDFAMASDLRDITDLLKKAIQIASPKPINPVAIHIGAAEWDGIW